MYISFTDIYEVLKLKKKSPVKAREGMAAIETISYAAS